MGGQQGPQHSADTDSATYWSGTLHFVSEKQDCINYWPVEIIWSVPCDDSNWDVVDIIVRELNKKNKDLI